MKSWFPENPVIPGKEGLVDPKNVLPHAVVCCLPWPRLSHAAVGGSKQSQECIYSFLPLLLVRSHLGSKPHFPLQQRTLRRMYLWCNYFIRAFTYIRWAAQCRQNVTFCLQWHLLQEVKSPNKRGTTLAIRAQCYKVVSFPSYCISGHKFITLFSRHSSLLSRSHSCL